VRSATKSMRIISAQAVTFLICLVLLQSGATLQAEVLPQGKPTATSDSDKMQKLLEASGLPNEKLAGNNWRVTYKRGQNDVIYLAVGEVGDFALIMCQVSKNPKVSMDELTQILKFGFGVNLAKVVLAPNDGTLWTMNETEFRLLDAISLKRIIVAVADFALHIADVLAEKRLPGGPPDSVKPAANLTASATSSADRAPDLLMPANTNQLTQLLLLNGHATIHYRPDEWKPEKGDDPGVFLFAHAEGNLRLRVVTNRIETPIDRMPEEQLATVKSVSQNVNLTRQGWRSVNGVRMLFVEMEATIQGVPLKYFTHFYSDASGAIEIRAFTPGLLEEYRQKIECFVSGFQIIRTSIKPAVTADSRREPLRVGLFVQESKLIHRVEPVYPELARRAHVEQMVMLEVRINEQGEVTDVRVVHGHPLLDQAAIEAVRQWRYEPTLLNGEPVPVLANQTVIFKLK